MKRRREFDGDGVVSGSEDPLNEDGKDEEYVERDGLHGVEPDVAAERGVSDDAQVESEEGHEARVRHRPVYRHQRQDRLQSHPHRRDSAEQVPTVLQRVEERQAVRRRRYQPLRRRR